MKILMGILMAVFALILLFAMSPTLEDMSNDMRGNESFNCAADPAYDSTLETNTLGCNISPFIVPLLILGVIFSLIMGIMYGRPEEEQYSQQYPQY